MVKVMMGRRSKRGCCYLSIQNVIGITLIILTFLWVFLYNYSSKGILTSDMSSEMVLAKLLSKGNGILSKEWIYSTELRVFNTQIIMSLLFRFLNDWSLIRAVGNVILLAGLLVSGFFMLKQLGIEEKNIILPLSLTILPFSEYQYIIMLIGGFYIPHVTFSFLVLGCLFKALKKDITINKERMFAWGGVFLTSIMAGLGGIRYLLIIFVPLFLAGVWSFVEELKTGCIDWRTKKYILFTSLSGAFGYILYTCVLSKIYVFDNYNDISFININTEDVGKRISQIIFSSINSIFGYSNNTRVFSMKGIANLCVFVYVFILLIMFISIYRRVGEYKLYIKFIICAIFCNAFVFVFTDTGYSSGMFIVRYFGPTLIFIFLIMPVFYQLEKNKAYKNLYYSMVTIALIILSLSNIKGLGKIDSNEVRRGALAYLVERDLRFGYATFWNANIATELTDGKIEVASVSNFETMHNFNYLTNKKYCDENYSNEKCFILLTLQENEQYKESKVILGGSLQYKDESFVVYVYPNSQMIYELAES